MREMQETRVHDLARTAGADLGRRRLLVAIGWLPLAACAGALAGCSSEEAPSQKPGTDAEVRPEVPVAPEKPRPVRQPGAAKPSPAQAGAPTPVTEVEAMQSLVEALQYVKKSAKPDQHCAVCQFYTAQTADYGSCQLFPQGVVSAGGWCTSWTARVTG